MKNNNNSGYSIILATLMIGFMLVLTSGVFLLVLGENKDTKNMEYYLKAFAGAEGSVELALLKAKQYQYSYSEEIKKLTPISKSLFGSGIYKYNKDVFISYELNSVTDKVTSKLLDVGKFDIIPLFHFDKNGNNKKVTNISISGLNNDIVWNIVGEEYGISGINNFSKTTPGNFKIFESGKLKYSLKQVGDFLNDSQKNYLILHNAGTIQVNYTLKSINAGEYFTKEASFIEGSGEIGGFKQNLKVKINNSEYLNLLKYSIFSN